MTKEEIINELIATNVILAIIETGYIDSLKTVSIMLENC